MNKGNAQRGVVDVLATLEAHTVFVCERPAKERQKLRSVQAVMDALPDAFPDVRLVIDAKEQRIQRPGGSDESGNSHQKPFYPGKKKAHTLTPTKPQDAGGRGPQRQFPVGEQERSRQCP